MSIKEITIKAIEVEVIEDYYTQNRPNQISKIRLIEHETVCDIALIGRGAKSTYTSYIYTVSMFFTNDKINTQINGTVNISKGIDLVIQELDSLIEKTIFSNEIVEQTTKKRVIHKI